jgi:hypothetical protein
MKWRAISTRMRLFVYLELEDNLTKIYGKLVSKRIHNLKIDLKRSEKHLQEQRKSLLFWS